MVAASKIHYFLAGLALFLAFALGLVAGPPSLSSSLPPGVPVSRTSVPVLRFGRGGVVGVVCLWLGGAVVGWWGGVVVWWWGGAGR